MGGEGERRRVVEEEKRQRPSANFAIQLLLADSEVSSCHIANIKIQ